jgi:hypothetical protein
MATQANNRIFHYIYKITRTYGSGKYYIGMHSTDALDDGYFGSGTLLARSIKKHGKEKHSKEILEHLSSREALKLREKELVNAELLGDKKCMNLKLGGEGGGGIWNAEHAKKFHSAGWASMNKTVDASARASKAGKTYSARVKDGAIHVIGSFIGRKHTEETKQKMRKPKNVGEANSQFGTCWVTKDKPVKIKKELLGEYLANGFSLGRKVFDNRLI